MLNEFESQTGTTPTQAAKLLGLAYPRYNELKNGTRTLKPYHVASIEAHMRLSKKSLKYLKVMRGITE